MHLELTMIMHRKSDGAQTVRTVLVSLYQIGMVVPLFEDDEEGGGCHIVTLDGNMVHVEEEYEVVCEGIENAKMNMNDLFWRAQDRERTTSQV